MPSKSKPLSEDEKKLVSHRVKQFVYSGIPASFIKKEMLIAQINGACDKKEKSNEDKQLKKFIEKRTGQSIAGTTKKTLSMLHNKKT